MHFAPIWCLCLALFLRSSGLRSLFPPQSFLLSLFLQIAFIFTPVIEEQSYAVREAAEKVRGVDGGKEKQQK